MSPCRCLLAGFALIACSRRAPMDGPPPPPRPIAQPAPPPPPTPAAAPAPSEVTAVARDASPPPGACSFAGGTARCTRCIERSCRVALAACCANDRCRAGLPGLGACLTSNTGNESALTGCWDMFNAEGGGTAAEPTLRECMEQGPCGICEVPR